MELCLTVPVRLSVLLPYLHMLMDPLVSALNGSKMLISQGLRTLELYVDNLQPDFLYDHIQVSGFNRMCTCTCTYTFACSFARHTTLVPLHVTIFSITV